MMASLWIPNCCPFSSNSHCMLVQTFQLTSSWMQIGWLSSLQLLDCYSILPGSQQFCKGNLDIYVSCAEQKRCILDISMVFINGVQSKFHSIRKFPIKTRSGHYFGIIVLNIYRHTMYRNMDFIYQYISNYVLQIHGWITKTKSIMSTR